jgi:hypothetical protein
MKLTAGRRRIIAENGGGAGVRLRKTADARR